MWDAAPMMSPRGAWERDEDGAAPLPTRRARHTQSPLASSGVAALTIEQCAFRRDYNRLRQQHVELLEQSGSSGRSSGALPAAMQVVDNEASRAWSEHDMLWAELRVQLAASTPPLYGALRSSRIGVNVRRLVCEYGLPHGGAHVGLRRLLWAAMSGAAADALITVPGTEEREQGIFEDAGIARLVEVPLGSTSAMKAALMTPPADVSVLSALSSRWAVWRAQTKTSSRSAPASRVRVARTVAIAVLLSTDAEAVVFRRMLRDDGLPDTFPSPEEEARIFACAMRGAAVAEGGVAAAAAIQLQFGDTPSARASWRWAVDVARLAQKLIFPGATAPDYVLPRYTLSARSGAMVRSSASCGALSGLAEPATTTDGVEAVEASSDNNDSVWLLRAVLTHALAGYWCFVPSLIIAPRSSAPDAVMWPMWQIAADEFALRTDTQLCATWLEAVAPALFEHLSTTPQRAAALRACIVALLRSTCSQSQLGSAAALDPRTALRVLDWIMLDGPVAAMLVAVALFTASAATLRSAESTADVVRALHDIVLGWSPDGNSADALMLRAIEAARSLCHRSGTAPNSAAPSPSAVDAEWKQKWNQRQLALDHLRGVRRRQIEAARARWSRQRVKAIRRESKRMARTLHLQRLEVDFSEMFPQKGSGGGDGGARGGGGGRRVTFR